MTVRTARARVVRSRVVVAVALALAGVAGCSAQPGAAAIVEGRAIPVGDVQDVTRELAPYQPESTTSDWLLRLVALPVFERVAEERGVGVSDQEARAALQALAESAPAAAEGAAEPEFGDAALRIARLSILQQRLQQLPDAPAVIEEISAQLAELDVEINPRYGTIDLAEGLGIVPVEHPWIVAADAAP